jgi:hypothetical protein
MPSFRRGQVSVEFFLLFAVVLVLFGLFFFFTNEVQHFTAFVSASGRSASVAYSVAHSINAAFLGADGLSVYVDIPVGYNITVQPHAIFATDSLNRSGSSPVLPINITLSVQTNASNLTIRNLNGTISVTG